VVLKRGCQVNQSSDYDFDEDNCVVRFKNSPATLDESIALCEHLVANPRVPEEANFLIDLRSVARLFQYDEIYKLIAWQKTHGFPLKGRFAFLVDRPATIGTANIFCALLQLQSAEAEMFDDEPSALAWLANAPRISGAYARPVAQDSTESTDTNQRSVGRR
jgi:hypothetical protein